MKLLKFQQKEGVESAQGSTDPVRRVFNHWLFMFARSPNRCKLDPVRKAAIGAALVLYDEDQLCAAIEGMAADPLDDCHSDKMRAAMREIEWLLARGSRIERWADMGDRLRLEALRREVAPEPEAVESIVDPAVAAAARERLRQMAATRRGAGG